MKSAFASPTTAVTTSSVPAPLSFTPEQMVQANLRQQNRLSWKRKEALQMASEIKTFLDDHDVPTPDTMKTYAQVKDKILAEFPGLGELFTLYYRLKETSQAAFALFERGGVLRPMLLMAWYSRHRLDPVWLMRKSQLVRKAYRTYLASASLGVDAKGEMIRLVDKCTPFHLTLTVPHPGGEYLGERFYAAAITAAFKTLRRRERWKSAVYGGEYGIEVKKGGEGNGLHIHIHSLVFVHRAALRTPKGEQPFKQWLIEAWREITGATEIWFEQLYTWCDEEDEGARPVPVYERIDGKRYIKTHTRDAGDGMAETIGEYRWKRYVDHRSTPEEYMKGVMECIKYHFKGDTMKTPDGKLDVPLVIEVLNRSKGLRMYDRFGAFRKVAELNFNRSTPAADSAEEGEREEEGEMDATGEDGAEGEGGSGEGSGLDAQSVPGAQDAADAADGEGVGVLLMGDDDVGRNGESDGAGGGDSESALMGKAALARANLLCPFTHTPATEADYRLCVARPEALDYTSHDAVQALADGATVGRRTGRQRRCPGWGHPRTTDFTELRPGVTLSEVAVALSSGSLGRLIYAGGIHRGPARVSRIMVGYWEPDWYVPEADCEGGGRRQDWLDSLAFLN